MNKFFSDLLEPEAKQSIKEIHSLQIAKYGVCVPPSLKQLVSLRHLLIRTGSMQHVISEELMGLSKAECSMLLKKLNRIYIVQRRRRRHEETGDEVEHVKTVAR